MTTKPALPYVWMLCGSMAFALMGVQARAAGMLCDWTIVALARALMPLVLGLVMIRISGARLVFLRPGILWMRSIAGSISLVCTFYALSRLPVADVFTITNMFPIWVALLSWPLLGETPPPIVWLSVASGVIGVWLIQEPALLGDNGLVLVVVVAASFSTAIAMLGLHRLRYLHAWAIVVHFSGVALVFSAGMFLVWGKESLSELDPRAAWLLLGVGTCATIGQFFLTKAFTAGVPGKVSVVALAQVPIALALEVIIWNRPVDAWIICGIVLVLAPTAWLMTRKTDGGQL